MADDVAKEQEIMLIQERIVNTLKTIPASQDVGAKKVLPYIEDLRSLSMKTDSLGKFMKPGEVARTSTDPQSTATRDTYFKEIMTIFDKASYASRNVPPTTVGYVDRFILTLKAWGKNPTDRRAVDTQHAQLMEGLVTDTLQKADAVVTKLDGMTGELGRSVPPVAALRQLITESQAAADGAVRKTHSDGGPWSIATTLNSVLTLIMVYAIVDAYHVYLIQNRDMDVVQDSRRLQTVYDTLTKTLRELRGLLDAVGR